ncbi:hypothetical protein [Bradyrhizobium erythrophlei]|jgi:hypothetical protein|uniref:Uncharacterized protein n=1 Tax=Bradyrhizobium erythrophlei TaxID=1437360 RepID=A0A1M7UXV8_9BRAD|nr:hypothetical protein [Bradyrhizobium erythrophlei]SHN87799.1 hypothetical protein SAMN05444170_7371 [Bradyrhizobium erythrophlei]
MAANAPRLVSPQNGGSFSVAVNTAKAAELEVPAYQRAHRYAHRRHYRVASYDMYCGGPYVGPGWHGGSYWGGPWMDLRCYGFY